MENYVLYFLEVEVEMYQVFFRSHQSVRKNTKNETKEFSKNRKFVKIWKIAIFPKIGHFRQVHL